jgi:hypothetical protein
MCITLKNGEKIDIDEELFSRSLSYDLTVSLLSDKRKEIDIKYIL